MHCVKILFEFWFFVKISHFFHIWFRWLPLFFSHYNSTSLFCLLCHTFFPVGICCLLSIIVIIVFVVNYCCFFVLFRKTITTMFHFRLSNRTVALVISVNCEGSLWYVWPGKCWFREKSTLDPFDCFICCSL